MNQPSFLTITQLGELARKSLDNSLDLVWEAELLASKGPCPRAFSLLILAAEEFGKHMMCFGAAGADPDDMAYWEDFWKRFRSHRPKYENFASHVAISLLAEQRAEFQRFFEQHVEADLETKLSGFYVDIKEGRVISPTETISEEQVEGLLLVLTTMIRSWAEDWDGVDAGGFAVMFEGGVERGSRELLKALRGKDMQAVAKFFESGNETSDDLEQPC